MDPNSDPTFNPTSTMNIFVHSWGQSCGGETLSPLPTNQDNLPSMTKLQHNLTIEEIKATQQDPHIRTILNALINHDRDIYLLLLLQNMVKLPSYFDVTMNLPHRITLNQNMNQAPSSS